MPTPATLEEVRERVRDDDCGKWDALVERDALHMSDGRLVLPDGSYPSETNRTPLEPTPWSTMQICQRLAIPTAYFRRCPTDLRDRQFNHWIEPGPSTSGRGPEPWLLRSRGSTLRGVLSERYTAMDNAALLDCLDPLVPEPYTLGWFELTGESFHLRILDPRLGREVLPDDRLQVGVHIANSEVGRRAVTVDAIVFRLVCTNGLIRLVNGRSLLHQRHIYLSHARFASVLQEAASQAITEAAGMLEQLAWATRRPVRNVEGTLSTLSTRWNLSDRFTTQVRRGLLNETPAQQETLYGLVNAITHAAQTLPPDERYDLEALAGRYLQSELSGNTTLPTESPSGIRRTRRPRIGDEPSPRPRVTEAMPALDDMPPWDLIPDGDLMPALLPDLASEEVLERCA